MKKSTYVKLSIAIIILVAILRFAFALTHTVSGDACWHLSASRFIATENKLPLFEGIGRLQPFWAPPVFHLVAAFFYKISAVFSLGFADAASKLVSPIFGTLTVVLLYLISRKLFDAKTAFYSMVFINFIPLFLDYSIFSYADSTTAFFSVLSVYFMIEKRFVLSSSSLGFAILSKYNAVFMYPMLLYLAYELTKNNKDFYKKFAIVVFLPLAISSVWFLRNFIILDNPFWPFLNGIFNGVNVGTSFNAIDLSPIFSLSTYLTSYLELFGVPNGNIGLISFFNSPFVAVLFFIWVAATLFFILPLVMGFFIKNNDKKFFLSSIYILFASYLAMLFFYLANVGWFGSRLLLPAVPFMGIIWARGMGKIKLKNIYLIILLAIGLGFVFVEAVKLNIASDEWSRYGQDFEWVKSNTGKQDMFFGNGQCLHYNIDRLVVFEIADIDFNTVDYVWINDKWRIDFPPSQRTLDKIENDKNLISVYDNSDTGTTIYQVKQ
jgi:hypothetical protein